MRKKTVDYQHGRMEVTAGRAGRHVATRQAVSVVQKQTAALDFTVWNHPAAAPAFAVAKTRFELFLDKIPNPAENAEWTIEDLATDAKSALPENN
jgi:hypothetical protein